jgi:hypothetical protein
VPKAVSDLIMQLLEKDPAARPQSASEVAARLQRLLAPTVELLPPEGGGASADPWSDIDETVEATPIKSSTSLEAANARSRLWLGIGIGTIAAAALFAVIFASTRNSTKDGTPSNTTEVDAGTDKSPRRKIPVNLGAEYRQFALRFLPGQHVEVPDLELPTEGPLTIEAYVTPADANNDVEGHVLGVKFQLRVVVGGDSGRGSDWGFHANVGKSGASISAKGVTARRTHVAAVRTAKEHRLYVDGKLVARTKVSGPLLAIGTPFSIGGDSFRGLIDLVRVSRVARYDAEFVPAPTFAGDKDTMLLFVFDEGDGNQLEDESANENDGFIRGATWVNKDGTPIKPGAKE